MISLRTSRPASAYRRLASSLVTLLITSLLVWLTTGCASGVIINNQPTTSLNFLQSVITQQIPRGVRTKSANQREFYSHYFSPYGNLDDDATERRERAYAQITILGDRRPYRTDIRVYRENKTDSGYKKSRLDKNLSRQVAARIQAALAKGRENRNVIDDFRPF